MFLVSLLFALPPAALIIQFILEKKALCNYAKSFQIVLSLVLLFLSIFIFLSHNNIFVINVASWPAPYGISLVFDTLSCLMLCFFSFLMLCINIYSLQDSALEKIQFSYYLGSWVLILGIIGALTTYDIFNLYVWSEIILVGGFILLSSTTQKNTNNIFHYAILNIFGTLLMLLAIALLYGITGNLNEAAIANSLKTSHSTIFTVSIALFLLGLAIKGGIFPFYFWLPENYPATSVSSTMLMSSLITKVIMIVILRIIWIWTPIQHTYITGIFIFLACCTMFFGVMGAANETKIRHILSFHIVSQLGYILLAIFIPTTLAIIAMLFFLIHNMLVKTNLLMVSGIIEDRFKTSNLTETTSIIKSSKLLCVIFFISAMSLAGFPPLSGFWGKFLIFKSAFNAHLYVALAIAIIVSLFTLYSMLKIWRFAFCENNLKTEKIHIIHIKNSEFIPLLCLLVIAVIIGFDPNIILPSLNKIANQIDNPKIIINSILGKA